MRKVSSLSREVAVLDPVRLIRIGAQAARGDPPRTPSSSLQTRRTSAVAFKREDVRCDAIQEPAIVS